MNKALILGVDGFNVGIAMPAVSIRIVVFLPFEAELTALRSLNPNRIFRVVSHNVIKRQRLTDN